jgi:hypothetical protein
MRRLSGAAAVLALSACASVDPYAADPIASHLLRDDAVGYCARLFADLDRQAERAAARDAESPRIDGFPYLRVDRFSAALAPRAAAGRARDAWVQRLAELDDAGRAAELANAALPADDVARCRLLLVEEDAGRFEELQTRARVPDAYSTTLRVAGLYPLTRLAFAAGVRLWQDDTRATFAAPLAALPVRGRLVRFGAGAGAEPVALPVPADALGVPLLSRFDRSALLQQHAPVLEIDVAGEHDRPGTVVLDGEDRAAVDPARPLAYVRTSHALLGGRPHVQLVYTFWFTERPARGWFDPLSGRLDGLVWRVTLGLDGRPLVYDTIHPCGCYHLFFPTERVRARPTPDSLDEALFAPQTVRSPAANEVVVVRLESGSHYVQRVSIEPRAGAAAVRYAFEDERRLAALPRAGGGTRSAFGADGLVAGSERGERFFFWPTGVESAGQMRQWGHHATAFVGRRHFDDPLLLETYFETGPAPAHAAR